MKPALHPIALSGLHPPPPPSLQPKLGTQCTPRLCHSCQLAAASPRRHGITTPPPASQLLHRCALTASEMALARRRSRLGQSICLGTRQVPCGGFAHHPEHQQLQLQIVDVRPSSMNMQSPPSSPSHSMIWCSRFPAFIVEFLRPLLPLRLRSFRICSGLRWLLHAANVASSCCCR